MHHPIRMLFYIIHNINPIQMYFQQLTSMQAKMYIGERKREYAANDLYKNMLSKRTSNENEE